MVIRDAGKNDVAGIARLHAESWRSAYRGILSNDYLEKLVYPDRLAVWEHLFSKNFQTDMFVMVAETNSTLAGFVCVFPDENDVFGSFLDNLHVAPELTGQGIGRKLLSESARRLVALGSAAGLYLWVIQQNPRVRRFYEKAGAKVADSVLNTMPDNQRVVALRCCWPDPKALVL